MAIGKGKSQVQCRCDFLKNSGNVVVPVQIRCPYCYAKVDLTLNSGYSCAVHAEASWRWWLASNNKIGDSAVLKSMLFRVRRCPAGKTSKPYLGHSRERSPYQSNSLGMPLCCRWTVKFDWDSLLLKSPWSGCGTAKVQEQSPEELHLWLKRRLKGWPCPSRRLRSTTLTGSFAAIVAKCLKLPTSKRTAACRSRWSTRSKALAASKKTAWTRCRWSSALRHLSTTESSCHSTERLRRQSNWSSGKALLSRRKDDSYSCTNRSRTFERQLRRATGR